MNIDQLVQAIDAVWDDSIVERLAAYIRIPNKSPTFDPDWERNGHMEAAITLMADWCRSQPVAGMRIEVRRLPGKTPLLFIEVAGELPGSVLMYGHLDKQPEFPGWLPELGPWEPVMRDGKLYGRGGADDGYAVFSSLTAIAALQAQKVPLARCVLLIEACEESGSVDLPAHLDALGEQIGTPSLVICLDAECGNYDQLWCTTSLRGNLVGKLRVRVLDEGVHSGMATGIAPTPARIIAQLMARVENAVTGDVLVDELQVTIPKDRREQITAAAAVLGSAVAGKVPFATGVQPVSNDPVELLINSTWRATVAITGADGLPATGVAGNVLLPEITYKISMRLAPTTAAAVATRAIKETLERDPPYAAQVSFEEAAASAGWNAPAFAPWLQESIANASRRIYGHAAIHMGSGGTIAFMGMLGARFPETQFFVTGVLGPQANAHGPNEFLHVPYAKKLTACVSLVLADHGQWLRGH
jgi:acetylornithine deacetylase/succinyl-diaminopimelate desuccinylase-like protein